MNAPQLPAEPDPAEHPLPGSPGPDRTAAGTPVPWQPARPVQPRLTEQVRQPYLDLVTQAYGAGLLSKPELDERLTLLLRATAPAELETYTADLKAALPAPAAEPEVAQVPAVAPDHRRRVLAWAAMSAALALGLLLTMWQVTGTVAFGAVGAVFGGLAVMFVVFWLLKPARTSTEGKDDDAERRRKRYGKEAMAFRSSAHLPPSIEQNVGDVRLYLSELILEADRTIDITVGTGDVRIWVPDDCNTVVNYHVNVGDYRGDEQRRSGIGVAGAEYFDEGEHGGPLLTINVRLKTGTIYVDD